MHVNVVHPGHVFCERGMSCLVCPLFEGDEPPGEVLRPEDVEVIREIMRAEIFRGKAGQVHFLHTPQQPYSSVLMLGLGKQDAFEPETLRRAAGTSCEILRRHRVTALLLDATGVEGLPVGALVDGILLGQYRFERYKNREPEEPVPPLVDSLTVLVKEGTELGETLDDCLVSAALCEHVNWARDLANTASNDLTPAALAEAAQGLARDFECTYECLEAGDMAKLGMRALLGVAAGSANPPKLITLKYHYADDAETIALVGKGVTFDAGGLSVKPSEGMHEMKFDMCGAAAVLGAMRDVCSAKPAVNLVCMVPAVENVIGASAQRPGDIVKAFNGKTVEVHNTDAEGRLILADTLAYLVKTHKPARIVDVATLTGACIVALGHHAAGLMGNDDALAQELEEAGRACGERVWRLPLWKDYSKLIGGTHGDLCNIGPAREAGAIIGGCFLQEFVEETPWAHLDIAGTAWGVKGVSYLEPKSATGFGVRLLARWIRASRTANKDHADSKKRRRR